MTKARSLDGQALQWKMVNCKVSVRMAGKLHDLRRRLLYSGQLYPHSSFVVCAYIYISDNNNLAGRVKN
jgi:hypothetical protein